MSYDVRIPVDDLRLLDAEQAVRWGLRRIKFQVPAAGPEIELRFDGGCGSEDDLVSELRDRGISVLATRSAHQ